MKPQSTIAFVGTFLALLGAGVAVSAQSPDVVLGKLNLEPSAYNPGPAPSATQSRKPTPAPEIKRLAFWEGHWTTTGKFYQKGNEAADVSGTKECEFFAGGYQMVCRSEEKNSTGETFRSMDIYSYDSTRKIFRNYFVSDDGVTAPATMKFEDNSWRITTDDIFVGAAVPALKQVRATITQNSATSFTTQLEGSDDGVNWFRLGESTGNRTAKP